MSENNYEFQIVTEASKSARIGEWLEKKGQTDSKKNYGVNLRQNAKNLYEIAKQADKEIQHLKAENERLKNQRITAELKLQWMIAELDGKEGFVTESVIREIYQDLEHHCKLEKEYRTTLDKKNYMNDLSQAKENGQRLAMEFIQAKCAELGIDLELKK